MKKSFFFILCLCYLAITQSSLALKPTEPSPLSTPTTHWDQGGMWVYDGDNRVVDSRDGRIQCVSQLYEGPYKGTAEEAARSFLMDHQDWVGFSPDEKNLVVDRIQESPVGNHVTFVRQVNGVLVYPGTMVITLDRENNVLFYFSSLYTFKDAVNTSTVLSEERAIQTALTYLHPKTEPRDQAYTELVIWAGDNRDFATCWKVKQYLENPNGDWEVLIDANSGQIRRVEDRACYYVAGSGMVHRPDPLTTAGANYGDAGYTDGSDANTAQLQAQRTSRTFPEITLTGSTYSLVGPYCQLVDWENPSGAPVTQVSNSAFNYTRDAQGFEDANVYYHIDLSQRWIQSLGFTNIQNLSIQCDAHGFNGDDNSHYIGFPSNRMAWGEGGVDDGEDADVIWHEYGHAIHHSQVSGWGGGDEGAMGEGFGDYWAGSYSHSVNTFHDSWVFNWDGHNTFWSGRVLNANYHYPENNNGGVHNAGQIWSQACYDAQINMNDRYVMDQIVLQSHFGLGSGASMLTAAQSIVTAAGALGYDEYYYAISDAFVPRGLLSRPSNDLCPGIVISSLPYSHSGATTLADDNYFSCTGSAPDVVYTLSPLSCNTTVTVSLCGSGFDTQITVLTSGSCPGSLLVDCNDDFCGLQSQLTFNATAGTTYYLVVSGYGTHAGSYTLNVTGTATPPANDECAGSIDFLSLPYSHSGNTCGGNASVAHCGGAAAPDVFYTMTLPYCQNVTVSLCGSIFDTRVEVRVGGVCPGTTLVACNDDFCGLQSQITFNAVGGTAYYIVVTGFGTNYGAYTLNVTDNGPFQAPNDHCAGSTVISALPYTDFGSTLCAGNDRVNCVGATSNDVFYSYTAPADCHNVTVSLCNSGFDCAVEIRAGGACPGDYSIACNDDYCGLLSQATFNTVGGTTYYFIVHGFGVNNGPFELNVTDGGAGAPANDLCSGVGNTIYQFPYSTIGTTACAANDYNSFPCFNAFSGGDVVYRIQPQSCQNITVSLCNSFYDSGVHVRSGSVCGGDVDVVCNDDFCNLQSIVTFNGQQYTDYWIYVDGYGSGSGTYILDITTTLCTPDSLVVQRIGTTNDIQLDWTSVATFLGNYNIYRSTTLPVPTDAGHLIGTAGLNTYVDAGIITSSTTQYYYAVTATSFLLQDDPDHGALDEMEQQQIEAKKALTLPTGINIAPYLDPANIQALNPNKPEEIPASESMKQQPARRLKIPTVKQP